MTIFGPSWRDLRLDHVQTFLDGAESEPLLWEAKGTDLSPHEVRRQVGAFANSHEGGYLILGADQREGAWVLDGVEFPDEPPVWISSVVAAGVRPRPVFDIQHWAVEGDDARHVAVVRVEPIAAPPCIVRGTVYERLPGQTVPVKESLRLADLFARGDKAHDVAQGKAAYAAQETARIGATMDRWDASHVQIALGCAAVAYRDDIGRRLFSAALRERLFDVRESRLPDMRGPIRPNVWDEVRQDARLLTAPALDVGFGRHVAMLAHWTGAIGIHLRYGVEESRSDSIVENMVEPAWKAAVELLPDLGGYGPAHVTLDIQFVAVHDGTTRLTRGPIAVRPDSLDLASITRELDRSQGIQAPEPDESG